MTGIFRVNGVKSKIAHRYRDRSAYQVWDVFLAPATGGMWCEIVSTTEPLKASLCKRAAELGFLVSLGARQTRFGWEIVTLEKAKEQATA